jgi:hypothetical protein
VLRHVRTRIKSPQTNGVVERFFGTLKYEHLFRGYIGDGDAPDMETHRFRIIYNTIRPHQGLNDRTPRQAYLNQPQAQNLPFSRLKTGRADKPSSCFRAEHSEFHRPFTYSPTFGMIGMVGHGVVPGGHWNH